MRRLPAVFRSHLTIHEVAPVGFDPAIIWPRGSSNPDCAFLLVNAYRIIARQAGIDAVRCEGMPWDAYW